MNSYPLTQLLNQAHEGNAPARGEIFTCLYEELRQIANRQLRGERCDLQATELVHEAFLNLFGSQPTTWENRRHFFGAAAQAMRRILIDLARYRTAQKRGGDRLRVTFTDAMLVSKMEVNCHELLDLNEAIQKLEMEDAILGQIVELRFFAGQSMETISEILGISLSSLERKWRFARAMLVSHLKGSIHHAM